MKLYLPLALAALAVSSVAFAEDQKPATGATIASPGDQNPASDQKAAFQARKKAVIAALNEAKAKGGDAGWLAEAEKQGREMIKEFPQNPEAYQLLMAAAQTAEGDKARALFKELDADNIPAPVRAAAKAEVAKLDMIGKPFELKFTAVDGREVDLASLKGKVVLVDFWATWCGPCVGEIPHVKEAYEKLHDKGFEIVGISFDQKKESLETFTKDKGMTWPQYFDGKGWGNEFGKKFGIRGIPQMWLINKKGELADMNGRADLTKKVEKMLAE
jgi:thiol-disulfide isomerase/thioredoxin